MSDIAEEEWEKIKDSVLVYVPGMEDAKDVEEIVLDALNKAYWQGVQDG